MVKGKIYAKHFPDGARVILDMASEPRPGDMVLAGFDDGFIFGYLRRFVDGVIELHFPDARYPRIHRQSRQVFRVVGAIFPKLGKRGRGSKLGARADHAADPLHDRVVVDAVVPDQERRMTVALGCGRNDCQALIGGQEIRRSSRENG